MPKCLVMLWWQSYKWTKGNSSRCSLMFINVLLLIVSGSCPLINQLTERCKLDRCDEPDEQTRMQWCVATVLVNNSNQYQPPELASDFRPNLSNVSQLEADRLDHFLYLWPLGNWLYIWLLIGRFGVTAPPRSLPQMTYCCSWWEVRYNVGNGSNATVSIFAPVVEWL